MTLSLIGRTAYRSFRNLWMLEELGLKYEHILAHPRSKLARGGKIPVLKDGDLEMCESAAINTYLGDKYDDARVLVPSTPRPLYEQTVHMICTELDAQGLWIHRKHDALGQFFGTIPDAVAAAKQNFEKSNRILVKQLGQEEYILGGAFTAADILYVHTLDWAQSIGWDEAWAEATDLERLQRYLDRCRSRPAYVKTVAKRRIEEEEERKKRVAEAGAKL